MSDVGKKVELAVYRNMEPGSLNGYESISRSEYYEGYSTYVRVSEKVEVTFEPLKSDAVLQDAFRALDAAELKARVDLQRTLDAIKDQRAQLQALTHKPDLDEADDDPAPYCSYGHKTKAQCDCGPIAAND